MPIRVKATLTLCRKFSKIAEIFSTVQNGPVCPDCWKLTYIVFSMFPICTCYKSLPASNPPDLLFACVVTLRWWHYRGAQFRGPKREGVEMDKRPYNFQSRTKFFFQSLHIRLAPLSTCWKIKKVENFKCSEKLWIWWVSSKKSSLNKWQWNYTDR